MMVFERREKRSVRAISTWATVSASPRSVSQYPFAIIPFHIIAVQDVLNLIRAERCGPHRAVLAKGLGRCMRCGHCREYFGCSVGTSLAWLSGQGLIGQPLRSTDGRGSGRSRSSMLVACMANHEISLQLIWHATAWSTARNTYHQQEI